MPACGPIRSLDEDGNVIKKKKKSLTGYTLFGKENKEEIKSEIQKLVDSGEEKVPHVSMQGTLWKKLSDEEKEEWNAKAKDSANDE